MLACRKRATLRQASRTPFWRRTRLRRSGGDFLERRRERLHRTENFRRRPTDYRLAAARRRRAGCCEMNLRSASRTTSARERRSEKAIARSASCCAASIAAKSVTGAESFFSPARAPRRDAPALVTRSVFIANLLFACYAPTERPPPGACASSMVARSL